MKKDYINYIIVVILLAFASFTGVYSAKEDATRDYAYESYVERMYEEDINYFLDVISESDKFIEYCNKHPEWTE